MSDIPIRYYNDCPICDKKLEYTSSYASARYRCSNGCYAITEDSKDKKYFIIRVFDESAQFLQPVYSRDIQKLENAVRDKIAYWKENDRYLMKMLEES